MKGILVAGIITTLTIVAVESQSCVQCNSLTNSCNNSAVSSCPKDANSSCTSSLVNSTLGGAITLYLDKSCSEKECNESEQVIPAFTVHVSDEEHVHFASQCCKGEGCNSKDISAYSQANEPRDTVCPACYGPDDASCNVKQQKCYQEERCVDIVANFKNGTGFQTLVLRGCSNVNDSTCRFLSASNQTIGGITFQKFDCTDSSPTSSTPTSSLSTSHASSSSTPPRSTMTSSPQTTNTGSKVSFIPFPLASFILLGMLL
ncbi:ly6/PLAUR domain-containing protein 8 [Orycteropus afer afer]|uniref:Ly6/PLAUR domain-containing protein 8 n=1 Tax=Orycteropus afer afer TaxID=1230840 RepID=A0A8B7B2E0_ORYAF|nr:ly6/PLAUR domain-containing protein 8 [Orycteropus afer afer]